MIFCYINIDLDVIQLHAQIQLCFKKKISTFQKDKKLSTWTWTLTVTSMTESTIMLRSKMTRIKNMHEQFFIKLRFYTQDMLSWYSLCTPPHDGKTQSCFLIYPGDHKFAITSLWLCALRKICASGCLYFEISNIPQQLGSEVIYVSLIAICKLVESITIMKLQYLNLRFCAISLKESA